MCMFVYMYNILYICMSEIHVSQFLHVSPDATLSMKGPSCGVWRCRIASFQVLGIWTVWTSSRQISTYLNERNWSTWSILIYLDLPPLHRTNCTCTEVSSYWIQRSVQGCSRQTRSWTHRGFFDFQSLHVLTQRYGKHLARNHKEPQHSNGFNGFNAIIVHAVMRDDAWWWWVKRSLWQKISSSMVGPTVHNGKYELYALPCSAHSQQHSLLCPPSKGFFFNIFILGWQLCCSKS